MFRHILFALFAAFVTSSIAAPRLQTTEEKMTGADAMKFFNAKGCKSCHATDELRIGPSYKMIALRYPVATPETIERLSLKVLHGGSGAWGTIPMISNPDVSMTESERIVRWILGTSSAK